MISLDSPTRFRPLVGQAHQVAMNMLRPISRKYDLAEHEYPKELDMLAAMIDGLSESGASEGAGAAGVRRDDENGDKTVKNGANLASVMSIAEMCWGDVGLLLSMPRQGLGNSAIASVADDDGEVRPLRQELVDHRLRQLDATHRDAPVGQRQRDAAGADRQLQRRAVAGERREEFDGRVEDLGLEHERRPLVVRRRGLRVPVVAARHVAHAPARAHRQPPISAVPPAAGCP